MNQSDRRAQAAIAQRDWTLQVLTLGQLARENRRLYKDILALPVPHRLNAQEKQKYMAMLKAQSLPYQKRAEQITPWWRSFVGGRLYSLTMS